MFLYILWEWNYGFFKTYTQSYLSHSFINTLLLYVHCLLIPSSQVKIVERHVEHCKVYYTVSALSIRTIFMTEFYYLKRCQVDSFDVPVRFISANYPSWHHQILIVAEIFVSTPYTVVSSTQLTYYRAIVSSPKWHRYDKK